MNHHHEWKQKLSQVAFPGPSAWIIRRESCELYAEETLMGKEVSRLTSIIFVPPTFFAKACLQILASRPTSVLASFLIVCSGFYLEQRPCYR